MAKSPIVALSEVITERDKLKAEVARLKRIIRTVYGYGSTALPTADHECWNEIVEGRETE